MKTEKRSLKAELRVEKRGEESQGSMITGHAAVFDQLSEDFGGWREKIAPGAFSATLEAGDDVRALFNHDPNWVLGRSTAGTLRMKETEHGLAVEIDAPDTQLVRDLVLSPMARGDISQMSFAFVVEKQSWEEMPDGSYVRTIDRAKLYDVAPVTYPAYPQTDVQVVRSSDGREEYEQLIASRATVKDEAVKRKHRQMLAELN